MTDKTPLAVKTMLPMLVLGPALTCIAPRVMAPLFIATAVLALAADAWERRARPGIDPLLALLFGGALVFGVLSRLWSINPDDTLSKAGQLLSVFGPLVCLIPLVSRLQAAHLRVLGLGAASGFGLGMAMYLFESFSDFLLWNLTHSDGANDLPDVKQNKPAFLLAVWAYMIFPFFVPRAGKSWRYAFLAGAAALFYATFRSQSASAQMILVGAPLLAAVLYVLPARASLMLTLAASAFLTLSMPAISMAVYEKTGWREATAFGNSVKSRIEIWNQASSRAMEKPLLGWGLNASPRLPNRDDRSQHDGSRIAHLHPHNAPLQIWFELGLVGIAAVLALFAVLGRRIAAMTNAAAQKYALFTWALLFLYTLSIWGIWQSWFVATLALGGLMTHAGARYLNLTAKA